MKAWTCFPLCAMTASLLFTTLAPTGLAAAPSYEECLTAWNKQKGWRRESNPHGFVDPSDSYDIFIVHDRENWVDITPRDNSYSDKYADHIETFENVTVGGFKAVKLHTKHQVFQTKYQKAWEHENWEYYCHDFRVLVRARSDAVSNQSGSDPVGLLNDYVTFAKECLKKEPVVFPDLPKGEIAGVLTDAGDPAPVTAEQFWLLDESKKHAVRTAVAYLRKKSEALAGSNPGMARILTTYADRINLAHINHQNKDNASGEASCGRWSGQITLYNPLTDPSAVFQKQLPLEQYDSKDVAALASVLMHEASHAHGASEWEAHQLQKETFDALGVSAGAGMRTFNQQYFESFSTPWDPRSEYLYVYWVEQHVSSTKTGKPVQAPPQSERWKNYLKKRQEKAGR